MKKIISLLLMCFMLGSNAAVLAAEIPSIEFLKQSALISNVEQSGTVNFKLNKPFELLDMANEDENLKGISNYIDISMLFESLFNSTMSVSTKLQVSAGGKKRLTETDIKSNVTFKPNNNLEGDFKTNYSVWSELDFSDDNNPYFSMIMTHPFAAKYVTSDSNLMLQNGAELSEEILGVYKVLLDSKTLINLNDHAVESIKKNAVITGNSKKVKIVFTDIGLKMYLADVVASVFEEINNNELEAFDMDIIKEALSKVPVFGNEAMIMEYTLDSNKRIFEEKVVLNVDLNIYDLMCALEEEEQLEEIEITRENSNIDFTVKTQTNFKYNSVKIEKPILTEENSIDIFEYSDPYYYDSEYDDEYYAEEDYFYPWCYADIDSNCFTDGEVRYVQLRNFFEEMDYSVSYDNGVITVKSDSKYAKHKEICFSIHSDTVYTESSEMKLCMPLAVKDGVSYISVDDCESLTYMRKRALWFDLETRYGYLEYEYENEYDYFDE